MDLDAREDPGRRTLHHDAVDSGIELKGGAADATPGDALAALIVDALGRMK
jgi:hypothetical protein